MTNVESIKIAADLIKTLITLAAGGLTLTLTFADKLFEKTGKHGRHFLRWGWICQITSIVIGLLALGVLINAGETPSAEAKALGSCRAYVFIQELFFASGFLLLMINGVNVIAKLGQATAAEVSDPQTDPQPKAELEQTLKEPASESAPPQDGVQSHLEIHD